MQYFKIAPHTFFFLVLTLLYALPTLITLFFDANEVMPYVSYIILPEFKETRWAVLWIYIISTLCFLFGSGITNYFIQNKLKIDERRVDLNESYGNTDKLNITQLIIIGAIIGLGVVLVFNMLRSGVFSASYMDSFELSFEAMNVFSLLCDVFYFTFIYIWINFKNKYKILKFLLIGLILVTLLKGSRMFTVPLLFALLYKTIYIDGLTKKKVLYIILGGILSLVGLFFIFFTRHDASIEGQDLGALLFLLVQYESCGVHIPLMKMINLGWHLSFSPVITFVTDLTIFFIPRLVFSEKNDYLYFDEIMLNYDLSPFGGTNGESSVILYFGILFPLFFIVFGAFLSFLYNISKVKENLHLKPLYIFICCSVMFTFLRNGLLIAAKNMIIMALLLIVLQLAQHIRIGKLK